MTHFFLLPRVFYSRFMQLTYLLVPRPMVIGVFQRYVVATSIRAYHRTDLFFSRLFHFQVPAGDRRPFWSVG